MFDLNKQTYKTPDGSKAFVDEGTSVKGRLYYVLPTAFINFGKKTQAMHKGVSGKIGYGLGVAHVRASGDIQLDGDGAEKYTVDVNRFGIVTGYLAELRVDSFAFRAVAVWPFLKDGGYEHTLTDWNFTIGYVHVF